MNKQENVYGNQTKAAVGFNILKLGQRDQQKPKQSQANSVQKNKNIQKIMNGQLDVSFVYSSIMKIGLQNKEEKESNNIFQKGIWQGLFSKKKKPIQYKLILTQSEKQQKCQHQKGQQKNKMNKPVKTDFQQNLFDIYFQTRDQFNQENPELDLLSLQTGSSFWSLDDDYQIIYKNFTLLSYFSSCWEIQIISRRYNKTSQQNYLYKDKFLTKIHEKPLYVEQRSRSQFSMNNKMQIKYVIIQIDQECNQVQYKINVIFESQIKFNQHKKIKLRHLRRKKQVIEQTRQYIHITIIDQDGWIQKNANWIQVKQHHHRISEMRKSKIWQTQYFYIQPQNQRNKLIKGPHFSIALQGGGCKGVQYIGAYRALIKNKIGVPITSVIGSSAGGIIGLAICLGLHPDQIIKICIQKFSKVTDDQKYQQSRQKNDEYFEAIIKNLRELNIFEDKIIDIIVSIIKDPRFKDIFLKILKCHTNPEIYKLFLDRKIKRQQGRDVLNMSGLLEAELMTGKVIKEIAIICLTKYLSKPIQQCTKEFRNKLIRFKSIYQNLTIEELAERITMKQLYNFTGVQFTCTAVDIDNYILRFLNQKTTPDLPVCCAIQMTGSFPAAFQAQTWKRQWGKYFIHYQNIRRQIDLTGCRLTDGGTLANFPVKYLDNQDMRPMYFSHVKTKDTIMFGLGLKTEIPHQEQDSKMAQSEQIMKQLKDLFIQKIGISAPLISLIKGCFKPKSKTIILEKNPQPFKQILDIPLIKFCINLLITYFDTKDNLTQQCFSHAVYETKVNQSYVNQVQKRLKPSQYIEQIERIRKCLLSELIPIKSLIQSSNQKYERRLHKDKFDKYNKKDIQQIFKSNLYNIKYAIQANIYSQKYLCQIQKHLSFIISSFLHNLNCNVPRVNGVKQKMSQMLSKSIQDVFEISNETQKYLYHVMEGVLKQKAFVLCDIQKDIQKLQKCAKVILQFCNRMKIGSNINIQPQSPLRSKKKSQSKDITTYLQILDQTLLSIRKNQENIIKLIHDQLEQHCSQNRIRIGREMVLCLSKLKNVAITVPMKSVNIVLKQIEKSKIPQFFVNFEANDHKDIIKAYTLKRIMQKFKGVHNDVQLQQDQNQENYQSQQKQDFVGIHVVLQSIVLSQLYFHQYYKTVKDVIFEYNKIIKNRPRENQRIIKQMISMGLNKKSNWKQKFVKVTTMTATGYHCLVMFLHASDLPPEKISQEVWKIRQLIKANKQMVQKKYQHYDWATLIPILLRQVQKRSIENKKDIFLQIQNLLKSNKVNNFMELKQQSNIQVQKIQASNQQMIEAMQNSLNYVVKMLMEISSKKSRNQKQKLKNLMEILVLNSPQISYRQTMSELSQNMKHITNFFFEKYKDILKYIVYKTPPIVQRIIHLLSPEDRKQAWKGVILSQIIQGQPIKQYVKSILKRLSLKPDLTLKQFFDNSSKKIQLNFSVVQEQFVTIYNHKTRPNMPIWAAILAASSTPQFFNPVIDRPQWKYKQQYNPHKRLVKSYFSRPKYPYTLITSSDRLTRLPIDLLKNIKFRNKITDRKNEIFLIFNFSQLKIPKQISNDLIQSMTIQPLTLGQILKQFVSFKQKIYTMIFKKQLNTTKQARNSRAIVEVPNMPTIQSKLKLLQLYIQSHDNLIRKLYKQQLVQFPIKFETLNFDKLTVIGENGQLQLSEICEDAIIQAEYIFTEKLTNRYRTQMKNYDKNINKSTLWKKILSMSMGSNFKQVQQNESNIQQSMKYSHKRFRSERRLYFRVQSIPIVYEQQQYRDKIVNLLSAKRQKIQNGSILSVEPSSSRQQRKRLNISQNMVENSFRRRKGQNQKYYQQTKNESDSINRTNSIIQIGLTEQNMEQQYNDSVFKIQGTQRKYKPCNNKLKLRFLSMLNPSSEVYQRYYIYYQKIQRDKKYRKKQQEDKINYVKLQTQQLIISEEQYYDQLKIKIQYPSSQLDKVKTCKFMLSFSQLFDLNKRVSNSQHKVFGYVYLLYFDRLYGETEQKKRQQLQKKMRFFGSDKDSQIKLNFLKPEPGYQDDYMNRKRHKKDEPLIKVRSDISKLCFNSILCQQCIMEFQIIRNKQLKQAIYRCLNCQIEHPINSRFQVNYDQNGTGQIKCSMGHIIQRCQAKISQKQINDICDLCGQGNYYKLWADTICDIKICDQCRLKSLQRHTSD